MDDGGRWNIVDKLFSGYAWYIFHNKTQILSFLYIFHTIKASSGRSDRPLWPKKANLQPHMLSDVWVEGFTRKKANGRVGKGS